MNAKLTPVKSATRLDLADRHESMVRQTFDYGRFKLNPINRPLRADKVASMVKAIGKKNLLHLYPIVVNRQLEVVDGQHRLKVAELLGVPIYYLVSDQMQIEDVPVVASEVDNWTKEEYLHYWCALGNLEYLKLRDFRAKHPWMTLGVAIKLCYYGDLGGGEDRHKVFATGGYTANDVEYAERVALVVKGFSDYIDFSFNSFFITAVNYLVAHADYDHKRMMAKMKYLSSKLHKCASADDYLVLLSEIYNHRVSLEAKVTFTKMGWRNPKYRVDRKRGGPDA